MASKVNASAQPWLQAFNWLPNVSGYVPQTTNPLIMPGEIQGTGSAFLREDCEAAYTSALQWVVTGTAARATKARQILNHMTTITQASGKHMPLGTAQYTPKCLYAAEILLHRSGGAGWPAGEVTAFNNWARNFILPRLTQIGETHNRGIPGGTRQDGGGGVLR